MMKKRFGEVAAFININREYYYRLAYSYAHNKDEAILIIQTSIEMAFETMKGLYNPLAMKAWFYKIVVDIAIDYLNDKKRFIIVKQVENITIPKELELLVKQKIVELELKTEKRERNIIRSFSIVAALIIIACVFTIIQFVV